MLIGATLLLLSVIVILSLVLGGGFISGITEIGINNEAIVNGSTHTFVVEPISIVYGIDTTTLVGAIGIITAVFIVAAALTGITVVSTGLNAQSAKLILLASGYIAIWAMLSVVAFGLIVSIEIFGGIIYVMLTIGYLIGVVQSLSAGD